MKKEIKNLEKAVEYTFKVDISREIYKNWYRINIR